MAAARTLIVHVTTDTQIKFNNFKNYIMEINLIL